MTTIIFFTMIMNLTKITCGSENIASSVAKNSPRSANTMITETIMILKIDLPNSTRPWVL
ncbi:hypothetical protein D3C87_2031050 [compost metagenome]